MLYPSLNGLFSYKFQLYDTGCAGWRWYRQFLQGYPNMILQVQSDTWDNLTKEGLVIC